MFGSNYFNKNSILRIEKGPFYFKFCILFNFQDPRFSFDFRPLLSRASVKVLVKDIPQRLVCQEVFSSFSDFFSLYLKVIQYFISQTILQPQSRILKTIIHTYDFEVWHLKYLYVIILFAGTEKYPRGRRGGFAKALGRATGAGVRIPPSPPKTQWAS